MRGFFAPTAKWLALLVVLAGSHLLLAELFGGREWDGLEIALLLPGWVGLFLPFSAFAGGLASLGALSSRSLTRRAVVLSILSYGLLAYGSPLADYTSRTHQGADLVAEYPLGPLTPSTLLQLRARLGAEPPSSYSFRVGRPFERPPNWLTYLLHSRVAVALFAILAALIGREAGYLTGTLPPPVRRNARWGLGLATGIVFFLMESGGGAWVRSDPSHSGLTGAWGALLLPIVGLVILRSLVRLSGRAHAERHPQAWNG